MGRWSESKHQQALNYMLNCDKYKLRNSTSTLSLDELVKPVTCFFHHEWCHLMTDATLCYDLREINKKTYKHFDNKQQINTKNDEWTILITPAKRKRRKKDDTHDNLQKSQKLSNSINSSSWGFSVVRG